MRTTIGPFDSFSETVTKLGSGGCLLVTGEKGNPMTIGWGMIGTIWGRPVFMVLVRPSRHSFSLLEAWGEFTVNVPPVTLAKVVALCGTQSGRDLDKVAAHGLALAESEHVRVPHLPQCQIHYECRVIHKSNVVNADLDPAIVRTSYAKGDFHRVYYGEILGVFREQ